MKKPSNEKVITTAPATLNNEMDVRMAFYTTQEATDRFSLIHFISEMTANTALM